MRTHTHAMTQGQADSQAPAAVRELHRPQVPYNFFSVSGRQRDVRHMARDQEACGAEQTPWQGLSTSKPRPETLGTPCNRELSARPLLVQTSPGRLFLPTR